MTDFRALCAEMHAAFNTYAVDEAHHNLLNRARAALAEGDGVGPTDEDLARFSHDGWRGNPVTFARAVLARYGTTHPRPIPVGERMPTAADLSDEGTVCFSCWWLCKRSGEHEWHRLPLMTTGACRYHGYTHWLPGAAIPLPQEPNE